MKDGARVRVMVSCGAYTSDFFEKILASGCEFRLPPQVAETLEEVSCLNPYEDIVFRLEVIGANGKIKSHRAIYNEVASLAELVPDSKNEADRRIDVSIRLRQGQSDFRNSLMQAYESKCAISGCDCADALEAAHIAPYRGKHTNAIKNGILLRADLHTLYDKKKLWIDKHFLVHIHKELKGTTYASLAGQRVFLPKDPKMRPLFCGKEA